MDGYTTLIVLGIGFSAINAIASYFWMRLAQDSANDALRYLGCINESLQRAVAEMDDDAPATSATPERE